MHFRKSKRALWIFTPSEMRLQRVKKTKFLKNSLRQEVVNSPQPFSSSCSSLHLLHSMGGVIRFFQKRMFLWKNWCLGSRWEGLWQTEITGVAPGVMGFRWDLGRRFRPIWKPLTGWVIKVLARSIMAQPWKRMWPCVWIMGSPVRKQNGSKSKSRWIFFRLFFGSKFNSNFS